MKGILISLAVLVALALIVVFALLSGHAAPTSAPTRTVPTQVSRDLPRISLWQPSTAEPVPTAQGMIPDATPTGGHLSPLAVTPSSPGAATASTSTARPAGRGSPTAAQWARLRACESGGNYAANTGNGYYGGYQFNLATWHSNGGVGRPDLATPAEQGRVARMLYARRGAAPWPVCGRWLR